MSNETQINSLKARIFDAEEKAREIETLLTQFVSELKTRLKVEDAVATDLNEYIKKVDELIVKAAGLDEPDTNV